MRRIIVLGLLLFSLVFTNGCQLLSGNSKKDEEKENSNIPKRTTDDFMKMKRPSF